MPKPSPERARPQLGDVVEIDTPKGLAYAQYTHEHTAPPRYGSLLRVLPGIHARRPDNFADLITQEERFSVFFPLHAALRRGIVRIVANEEIPAAKTPFPTFRARHVENGVAGPWWIWDGSKESRLAGQRDSWTPRAVHAVWNDTLLIERINSDWTPDDDPEFSST